MSKFWSFIVCSLLALCFATRATAFYIPEAQPLPKIVAQASLIVVATITDYTRDPTDVDPKFKNGLLGYEGVVAINTLKARGTYRFQVQQILQGQSEPNLQLVIPRFLSEAFDQAKPSFEKGTKVLLLLKRDEKGQLVPVDSVLPLIPLAQDAKTSEDATLSAEAHVVELLLASLQEPTLRQADAYLLRTEKAPAVTPLLVRGLTSYIGDPAPEVRDSVLYTLIENNQVAMIPLVAQLNREYEAGIGTPKRTGNAASILALRDLTTPEAVPYLNPLLFESDQFLRLSAIDTLRSLSADTYNPYVAGSVDRRSIPYLLLALYDPDMQNLIAPSAYLLLRKAAPQAGAVTNTDLFEQITNTILQHRASEAAKFWAWWRDDLSGQHPHPDADELASPVALKAAHDARGMTPDAARSTLQPLLFHHDVTVRRAALQALTPFADRSTAPYLLIAARDPDVTVAFTSYRMLRRIVKVGDPTLYAAQFMTNREAALRPLMAWWHDQLAAQNPHPPTVKPLPTTSKAAR